MEQEMEEWEVKCLLPPSFDVVGYYPTERGVELEKQLLCPLIPSGDGGYHLK